MVYRNRTYVAFDGDNDIRFYRMMNMWKQSNNSSFTFSDAHDINNARDTSSEETIKRRLRERMANSKVFILLVGNQTKYLYKFVRWEIEMAIKLGMPIIVVNLPKIAGQEGLRNLDDERCPKIAKETLAIHISFRARILEHALENWPQWHYKYQKDGKSGPYFYDSNIYNGFGL